MATPPRLQIKRTLTANNPPAALEEGELSVELGGPIRLWAGHPTDPAGKVLLTDSSAGGGGPVDAYTKAESDGRFVNIDGDTMTGLLAINGPGDARLTINKNGANSSEILSQIGGVNMWRMQMGDNGEDFTLLSYPSGAYMYWIEKAGGFYYQNDLTHKPAGGEWIAASDARIKTVISDYDTGLDAIKQLMPVRYTYNGNDAVKRSNSTPSPSLNASVLGKEFIGLVAQEAEGPMPEMVKSVEGFIDGAPVYDLRMMDASALKYALVNAVKELALRVETLEAQLAATRK